MNEILIDRTRIKKLKGGQSKGKYVLYWMQASQRAEYNLALEVALDIANNHKQPLIVCFCITPRFPEANLRSYYFMLQGIQKVSDQLKNRKIRFVCSIGSPEKVIPAIAEKASFIVFDRGYTSVVLGWRSRVVKELTAPVYEVEDNVIVPVSVASHKEEYSAATIRKKLMNQLSRYAKKIPQLETEVNSLNRSVKVDEVELDDLESLLKKLELDDSVFPSPIFQGGSEQANVLLRDFIENRIEHYHEWRNDPSKQCQSSLSPYIHFGQASPIFIALEAMKYPGAGTDAFIEELFVRRELAINFVHYNNHYDSIEALPGWALSTLEDHSSDKRPYLYSLEDLESASTHDRYWNAAQMELLITGKMHNYMRMYWGKKIIEWTESPKTAFDIMIHLNNKYELDGRDPNSFAGILWCFGKHDRPWKERPIFGKVRYMNSSGLERKFDMNSYVEQVRALKKERNT